MRILFAGTAVCLCALSLSGCGKDEPTTEKSSGAIHSRIKEHTQTTETVVAGESNIAFFSESHMPPERRLRSRQQRLQRTLE